MAFNDKFTIASRYLPKPSKRRSGLPANKIRFLVAHDTGNPGSTASQNVSYYTNSCNDMSASAHLFVDDKEILECIPALTDTPEKAWHVLYDVPKDNELYGVNANDAAIGVEYCYGTNIDADKAYAKYVWVLAKLCDRFGLDPAKDIVGHFFLDPQRKTDPNTGLGFSRRTYEGLIRDVVTEYQNCSQPASAATKYTAINQKGTAVTNLKLNLRDQPKTHSNVVQVIEARTTVSFVAKITDGEPVNNNPVWYQDVNGNFFWGGGVTIADLPVSETDNGRIIAAIPEVDFGNLDLPVTQHQCLSCAAWLRTHFNDQFDLAVVSTPFEKELLFAIACQETAIYWQKWINDHTPDEILARCVFDASGDANGTRSVFPKNTADFISKYDQALADMLIAEANATRAWRSWGPKQWVYAGYGIFQYDIQAILTDEAFFSEKRWYNMEDCLSRVIKELNSKWAAHPNDLFNTVRSYNGSGTKAENYARNVFRFLNWIQTEA